MFAAAVTAIFTIGHGALIAWSWISFITKAIARRTGRTNGVPFLDEVIWDRFDKSLLDLGLFGGAPVLPHRRDSTLLDSQSRHQPRLEDVLRQPQTPLTTLTSAVWPVSAGKNLGRTRAVETRAITFSERANVAHRT